jgi:hypothetical protein
VCPHEARRQVPQRILVTYGEVIESRSISLSAAA